MDDELRARLSASPKSTPAALLYDTLGSALFEAITLLPEYPITRTDFALLDAHAAEAVALVASRDAPVDVIELGPGHGRKARIVLDRLARIQEATRFFAVDVAASAIEACRLNLEDVAGLEVVGIQEPFLAGLARARRAEPSRRKLVLFLGSNLSNIDRPDVPRFLGAVRESLNPGDALLLSADLDKPLSQLLPAYDDPIGLTAAFNKNVLARLNREQGADFDLAFFAHEARWNSRERRVEMHLRALRPCTVRVPGLGLELRFGEGETIWTESSHRFSVEELGGWAAHAGFAVERTWISDGWSLALTLLRA